MSQDQLLHLSSSSFFLGFWIYLLAAIFYVAHVITPEAEAKGISVTQAAVVALGAGGPLFSRHGLVSPRPRWRTSASR